MAKSSKIVRYKKPMNINVGMIIFAMIFVYLSFSVYTYIRRDKIQFYEVVEGSIVNDKSYTGIIFREENVITTDRAGYVNYYIREGKRAAAGARVYSLDETGQMEKFLAENQGAGMALSNENLSDLKKQLSSFTLSYNDNNFSGVYDEKYSLQASVAEYVNFNALDNLDALMKEKGIKYEQIYSDRAGVVSYALDSYEGYEPNDVTESMFDRSTYKRSIGKSGQRIEIGAKVYKLITSEDWSVIFPISDEDKTAYEGKNTMKIKVPGNNLTLTGRYSLITGADGLSYGKLEFDKFMVQFVSDRFLNFELMSNEAEGLKIPASAITTKEFFTIPVEYLSQGGNQTSSETGFYKEVYSESGEPSIVFIPVSIYNATEEVYYVDKGENSQFKSGDYVVKQDSSDRYQIGATATLEGVYNINKGYAVFKLIKELANNGEYYTVEKGTKYGLSVYDHIVLDAGTVTEGQIIYQ